MEGSIAVSRIIIIAIKMTLDNPGKPVSNTLNRTENDTHYLDWSANCFSVPLFSGAHTIGLWRLSTIPIVFAKLVLTLCTFYHVPIGHLFCCLQVTRKNLRRHRGGLGGQTLLIRRLRGGHEASAAEFPNGLPRSRRIELSGVRNVRKD